MKCHNGSEWPDSGDADLDAAVREVRASFAGRTGLDPAHPKPVYYAHQAHYSPDSLISAYRWDWRMSVSAEQFQQLRPQLRAWVGGAHCARPATARAYLDVLTRFLGWCLDHDLPLEAETVLHPEVIETYCASGLPGRSTRSISTMRGALRTIAVANTRKAPWPRPAATMPKYAYVTAPYTDDQVTWLWDIARDQGVERSTRVMGTMLAFGLGCGMTPHEIECVEARHIISHPTMPQVRLIVLPTRVIPARTTCTPAINELCALAPQGPIVGVTRRGADALTRGRTPLTIPTALTPFTIDRLRTTWAVNVLNDGVPVSAFVQIAAGTSGQNLHFYTRHLRPAHLADTTWVTRAIGGTQR